MTDACAGVKREQAAMWIITMVTGGVGQSKHVTIERSMKGREEWLGFRVQKGRIYTMKVSK